MISPERDAPLRGAWVRLEGERIAAVLDGPPDGPRPDERTLLDGRGRTLVPGLLDTHVHLAKVNGMNGHWRHERPDLVESYRRQLPRSYLYYGFTTLVDPNVWAPQVIADMEAAPLSPDIFHCGQHLALANGFAMFEEDPATRLADNPNFLYDSYGPQHLGGEWDLSQHTPEATVARIAESGAICVKTYFENGFAGTTPVTWEMPTVEIIRDVADAARDRGLVTMLHANSYEAQAFGFAAGVDVIAHGMWYYGPGWDLKRLDLTEPPQHARELLERIARAGIGFQPTVRVVGSQRALFDAGYLADPRLAAVVPPALLSWMRSDEGAWHREPLRGLIEEFLGPTDDAAAYHLMDNFVRRAAASGAVVAAAGGRLLLGTDTPSGVAYGNPPGLNGYLEMRTWHEQGIPLAAIFRAATLDNAIAFHLDDRYGSIEPGKVANLLLLDGNPLETIDAWEAIETVFVHGRPVPRWELAADAVAAGA